MSLSTEVTLVWSSVSSAFKNLSVSCSTSSVSSFSVEGSSVVMVSGSGSNTSSELHVSANNLSTVVVIPEVVRGQWSPSAIFGFSFNPTFSGDSEFTTGSNIMWSPWYT